MNCRGHQGTDQRQVKTATSVIPTHFHGNAGQLTQPAPLTRTVIQINGHGYWQCVLFRLLLNEILHSQSSPATFHKQFVYSRNLAVTTAEQCLLPAL